MESWHSYPFLALCLGIAGVFVILSFFRTPTAPETALFQVIILISGLLGSYIFGRNAGQAGARSESKRYARPAFRRVTALYNSLFRLSVRIEELKGEKPDHRLDQVQALVDEHIQTGQDAMEDWRDISPDDVEEILDRLRKSRGESTSNDEVR